jgi:hypothetical protein
MPQKNDMILSLNQEAQELKKKGVDVTNGAIGMMYLDDGHLPVSAGIRAQLSPPHRRPRFGLFLGRREQRLSRSAAALVFGLGL